MELSNRIREGNLHAFIEVGPNVLHPTGEQNTFQIKYHGKNAAIDNIRNWLNNTINPYLRKIRLSEAGVDESKADEIMAWLQVVALGLVSVDEVTGEIT